MSAMKTLFGMGNPLLDISANVTAEFLAKYKLNINDACLEAPEQAGLYEELVKNPSVQYIAGGATQNSIRVFAGLVGEKGVASYTGCIGDDSYGTRMKELCEKQNVTTEYCIDKDHSTGVCGIGIVGVYRSMCTRLDAAQHYRLDFLKSTAWKLVEGADMVYSAGFFLTVCPEGMKLAGDHCAKSNKLFITNLSAPFLVEHFQKPMMEVFFYADYVIGNEQEWATFGKVHKYETEDLTEIAKRAAKLPKANPKRPRVVIVTQGHNPTIVVTQPHDKPEMPEAEIANFDVVSLEESQIVDTNAAGDAFVGGLLYGLSSWGGSSLKSAIDYAHYAAAHIIQRSGCCFDFKDKPAPPVAA